MGWNGNIPPKRMFQLPWCSLYLILKRVQGLGPWSFQGGIGSPEGLRGGNRNPPLGPLAQRSAFLLLHKATNSRPAFGGPYARPNWHTPRSPHWGAIRANQAPSANTSHPAQANQHPARPAGGATWAMPGPIWQRLARRRATKKPRHPAGPHVFKTHPHHLPAWPQAIINYTPSPAAPNTNTRPPAWARSRTGSRWCSCKGCSIPRPRS